ncbi:MAG: circadian clock KaiB family protein [Desulfohalobiaceae bacterium]|nr:circadian clock KaiB family protein [Desulfohalobiaceae bacterium]
MAPEKHESRDRGNNHSDQDKTGENQDNEHLRSSVQLRLFVSGSTSRSQQAIQNLRQICEEHLQGQYELEVIDLAQDPGQARQHQILAVPTLLKELPPPLRKIVGDLSEKEKVLEGLDIKPKEPE